MNKPETKETLDIIQKLVAAEEEEALRIFHSRAFGPRIKALVRAEEKRRRSSLWRRIPLSAWTGAALLAIAAAIALIVFIQRPPRLSPVWTIENVLEQAPGARTLLDRTTAALNVTETRPSAFESAILKALGPSAKDSASRTLGKAEPASFPTSPKIPRLGLEKTYEILIGEKSIERVLSSLKNLKEV